MCLFKTLFFYFKFKPPIPSSKFLPFLILLSDSNFLHRLNLETGQVLDTFYLGPLSRSKFISLDWAKENEALLLSSKIKNDKDLMIILSINPLKFEACFVIDHKVGLLIRCS